MGDLLNGAEAPRAVEPAEKLRPNGSASTNDNRDDGKGTYGAPMISLRQRALIEFALDNLVWFMLLFVLAAFSLFVPDYFQLGIFANIIEASSVLRSWTSFATAARYVSMRAALSSVAISASMNWMASWFAIG